MAKYVLLKELATEMGIDRTGVRRYAKRHGMNSITVRDPSANNQEVLALTAEDAEALREARAAEGYLKAHAIQPNGIGFVYIVQLLPCVQPTRLKLGFATDIEARLATYHTICPEAKVIAQWPCRQVWEAAAIRAATAKYTEQIGQEVFLAASVDAVIEAANRFFVMMEE